MGDLINLNRARKAKTKAASTAKAEANRAKFGRTGAEKAAETADRIRRAAMLDSARRDKGDED